MRHTMHWCLARNQELPIAMSSSRGLRAVGVERVDGLFQRL